MTCGTCRKCAYFDMMTNLAPIGCDAEPINWCVKRQRQRKIDEERCEDYKVHELRKDWSDN